MKRKGWSTLITGMALFSMFFGAGNLVFPLMLGAESGSQNGWAVLGLGISAVLFPLIGLFAMMLYSGDTQSFFGRIGKWPGAVFFFIIQAIQGPFGSIPRLITLMHATIKPYLPMVGLPLFSVLICGLIFALCYRPQRIVDLLGRILTPILLLSLGAIIVIGIFVHPEATPSAQPISTMVSNGLATGYNTHDLIASFLFSALIIGHFRREGSDNKEVAARFGKASLIAAGLLGTTYAGLSFVSAYYAPHLTGINGPEELLNGIAHAVLGPYGGIVASIAVAMACLTTAISLVAICSSYIQKDLLKDKAIPFLPAAITLGLSCLVANLGFTGIASMLSPILHICYPALIVLSIANIFHRLYSFKPVKLPVAAAFGLAAYLMF